MRNSSLSMFLVAAGLVNLNLSAARAATFTVTTNSDSGPGTLRQALIDAHANGATADDIVFNIGGAGPHTITVLTGLPGLVFPNTQVRADSQPGYAIGAPAIQLVPAVGGGAQTTAVFASSSGGCSVRGFHISGFTNVPAVDFGGLASFGACTAAANMLIHNGNGVYIGGGAGHVIGGNAIGERNVISSNTDVGVRFEGGSNCVVLGNFIGTSPDGLSAWPNRLTAIHLRNSPGTTIRGTPAFPQVLSGNGNGGISISTNARGSLIVGNLIGVDVTGMQALSNDNAGISLSGSAGVTIGGINPGERNVISGNREYGIFLLDGAVSNIVQANLIGLASNGVAAISNRLSGVHIFNSSSNLIGGGTGRGNYIAGNQGIGIVIEGTGSVGNLVYGNVLGMGPALIAVPNLNNANIRVINARENRIGGAGAGEGNTVVHHALYGIIIEGSSAVNNVVSGNLVGLDSAGARRGHYVGIHIVNAPSNVVGAFAAAGRNVVSASINNGIDVVSGSHGTVILGNYVGLDPTGSFAVTNGNYGILISDSDNVRIGLGTGTNVISGNRLAGIQVEGSSSNTVITANCVGTSADGLTAIPNNSGISIRAPYTMVGGTNTGDRNTLSGNATYGVEYVTGQQVRIAGNFIGLSSDGMTAVPNYTGVRLLGGANGAFLGGPESSARNVISRNLGDEVIVESGLGGHTIQNNYIGLRGDGVLFGSLNGGTGLLLTDSSGNSILGNVISECNDGLMIMGTGSFANVVQGNRIGTDPFGGEDGGHFNWGVIILNASSNRVGGLTPTERNVIAFSQGGILVTNSAGTNALGNLLAANLIYSNSPQPNIDLGGDGLTPNDALDSDTGANQLQNSPTLTNGFIGGSLLVYAQGVLTSAPLKTYAVDIYRNPDGTNAGSRIYLGRVPVMTDAGGEGAFTAGFMFNLATSVFLSATATDPENNTSEFNRSPRPLSDLSGDTDGDKIPNFWENLYGLNPNASNPASADADFDGYFDLDEYIADTAANDSNAYPRISSISNSGPAQVTFPSSGLRTYRLEYNSALVTNPVWAQAGSAITGQYGYTTLPDPAAATNRDYRLITRLPP